MTTTFTAATTPSHASAPDLNTGSGVATIPDWVPEAASAAKIDHKGVSIWRENGVIVLRLQFSDREHAEFEVDPSGLPDTAEEALEVIESKLGGIIDKPLVHTEIFQSLAEHHKVRSLNAVGDKVELDLTLAENATIAGDFSHSLIELRGTSATLSSFSLRGASALHLSLDEMSCQKVSLETTAAMSGSVGELIIEANGTRIASHHATNLVVDQLTIAAEVTERVSAIFKGFVFSKELINPSIFSGRTVNLEAAQVQQLKVDHNQLVMKELLQEELLRPKGDAGYVPLADSFGITDGVVTRRYLPLEGKKSVNECLLVELPLPSDFAMPAESKATGRGTPRLCLVVPIEQYVNDIRESRPGEASARFGFMLPEGEKSERFSEFEEIGAEFPLYCHAFWYLLKMYGGKNRQSLLKFFSVASTRSATQVI